MTPVVVWQLQRTREQREGEGEGEEEGGSSGREDGGGGGARGGQQAPSYRATRKCNGHLLRLALMTVGFA